MESINLDLIIAVAIGIYEVLSRIVPTSKTWSIIGNVLIFLKKISDVLDFKKAKKGKWFVSYVLVLFVIDLGLEAPVYLWGFFSAQFS